MGTLTVGVELKVNLYDTLLIQSEFRYLDLNENNKDRALLSVGTEYL